MARRRPCLLTRGRIDRDTARGGGCRRRSRRRCWPRRVHHPGGALDRETHARGVTVYGPRRQDPAAPARALRGRREPAPGPVVSPGAPDARPRRPWRAGAHAGRAGERAQRRAAHVRGRAGGAVAPAAGGRRAAAGGPSASAAGCDSLSRAGGRARARRLDRPLRVPLESEEHNAQISLLTGIAADWPILAAAEPR